MFAQTRQAKRRIVALLALIQLVFGATAVVISQSASVSRVNAATSFDHVVIGIMENHGYSQIIGSSAAPYENALAQQNALMTQSFAIGHPSEPNYHELWSGSNQGVTDDSCPHTFTTPSLGRTGSANGGNYARKHNPGADWVVSQDAAHNKTYNAWPADFTTLPKVSLVVPNLCNDM